MRMEMEKKGKVRISQIHQLKPLLLPKRVSEIIHISIKIPSVSINLSKIS
jgi:hypothetical protein